VSATWLALCPALCRFLGKSLDLVPTLVTRHKLTACKVIAKIDATANDVPAAFRPKG
jgi:hypothetical protein